MTDDMDIKVFFFLSEIIPGNFEQKGGTAGGK